MPSEVPDLRAVDVNRLPISDLVALREKAEARRDLPLLVDREREIVLSPRDTLALLDEIEGLRGILQDALAELEAACGVTEESVRLRNRATTCSSSGPRLEPA